MSFGYRFMVVRRTTASVFLVVRRLFRLSRAHEQPDNHNFERWSGPIEEMQTVRMWTLIIERVSFYWYDTILLWLKNFNGPFCKPYGEGKKTPCFTGEQIPKSGRSVGHIFFFTFFAKITRKNRDFFLLASLEIFHSNFCPKNGWFYNFWE